MANIVVMGGGAGMKAVLGSLKDSPHHLTALVPMIANGGSSGRLRNDLGVCPVGNIRQVLHALSDWDDDLKQITRYRFKHGDLRGHNAANVFLAAIQKCTSSIFEAVDVAKKYWNVQHDIIPLCEEPVDFCFMLDNGELLCGERIIDELDFDTQANITNYFLEPQVTVSEPLRRAIEQADYIIIGPGDFSFIVSSFLIQGFTNLLKNCSAKKIYISNISNRIGITTQFTLKMFVNEIQKHVGDLDYVLYNTDHNYDVEFEKFLVNDLNKSDLENASFQLVERNFVSESSFHKPERSLLGAFKSCLWHDQGKLIEVFKEIIT